MVFKKLPLMLKLKQTNTRSPTPMIPKGWVATGLRAPDLWVNVMLPVYTAGQDIYLFWLARCVCVCVTHTHTASDRLAPPVTVQGDSNPVETMEYKFILYLLERLLHFTAHLSLWLEQCLYAL